MSRRLAGTAAASALAIAVAVTVGPVWVGVLTTLALVLGWALWATCPPGVSIGRHLGAQAGRVVLDAVHAVLRAVVATVVVLALLAAGWSWIQPRLAAAVDHQVDQVVDRTLGRASDSVTSHAGLPDQMTRAWDHFTKGTTR